MHNAVREYLEPYSHSLCFAEVILEIGGRDINGTVRDLWPRATWISVDLLPGPGVDIVGDFRNHDHPFKVDLVVCTEVFEHVPYWKELIAAAKHNLKENGVLLLTMATGNRKPHSAIDGNEVRMHEWYKNVSPKELEQELKKHFTHVEIDVKGADLRASAQTIAIYQCLCGEEFVGTDILQHSCERMYIND